jgi:type I restriction enzyme M protein
MPGRFVGLEEEEDDSEVFDERMKHLNSELSNEMKHGEELDQEIRRNLRSIGYGW